MRQLETMMPATAVRGGPHTDCGKNGREDEKTSRQQNRLTTRRSNVHGRILGDHGVDGIEVFTEDSARSSGQRRRPSARGWFRHSRPQADLPVQKWGNARKWSRSSPVRLQSDRL